MEQERVPLKLRKARKPSTIIFVKKKALPRPHRRVIDERHRPPLAPAGKLGPGGRRWPPGRAPAAGGQALSLVSLTLCSGCLHRCSVNVNAYHQRDVIGGAEEK